MTKTKRISTALLAILSLFLFSFALTACGESKIELVKDFKLEYNIGEELDVSGGVIKYTNGGEEKLVSLTADMVTGFNSQTAGERTLIITYEDLQTTIKYTVAPEYVALNIRYTCTTPGVQDYLIFTDETTMVYSTTYPDMDPEDTTFANGTREIKDNKWEITCGGVEVDCGWYCKWCCGCDVIRFSDIPRASRGLGTRCFLCRGIGKRWARRSRWSFFRFWPSIRLLLLLPVWGSACVRTSFFHCNLRLCTGFLFYMVRRIRRGLFHSVPGGGGRLWVGLLRRFPVSILVLVSDR